MKKIANILSVTCVYTTLFTLLLAVFIKQMGYIGTAAVTIDQYLMILLLSFVLSLCGLVFMIHSLPKAILYVIHYLLCTVCFTVLFYLFGKLGPSADAPVIFGILLFTVMYLPVAAMYLIIKRLSAKKNGAEGDTKQKPEEYTSIFK